MIQKSSNPRGRPRCFCEEAVLEKATRVFWAKGYDGTTIDDLVEGMGIPRQSFYTVFGDKPSLFMRCLQSYGESLGARAVDALFGPTDVREGIRGILRFSVENATVDGSPWGCLMVCVAPLVEDDRVRKFLVESGAQATKLVEERLLEGVKAGQLPADFPTAVRSRQVMDLSRGLVIRARIGVAREQLLADAEQAAELVLG
jgi:AcrR family transcriptional regulator